MLQLPEALGQHGRAHPRQPRSKIGESLRSGEQLAKQEQGPPVTDHVQGKGNRAELTILPAAVRPGGRHFKLDSRRHYFGI